MYASLKISYEYERDLLPGGDPRRAKIQAALDKLTADYVQKKADINLVDLAGRWVLWSSEPVRFYSRCVDRIPKQIVDPDPESEQKF